MQLASNQKKPNDQEDVAVDLRGADRFAVPESRADVHRRRLCGGRGGHDGAQDRQRSSALAMRRVSDRRHRQLPARSRCTGTERADRRAHRRSRPRVWETRYQIGAMVYAIALGTWCSVTLLFSDDAVAHMICVSVTIGYSAGGAGRTYGRPWIFHVQILLACGPTAIALALTAALLLHRHGRRQRGVLPGAEADLDQSAADLRAGADGARARGGAGRPVRHRPEQHARTACACSPPTGGLPS